MIPSEELIRAYKTMFATDHGKRVLEDLSAACMEDRQTFVCGSPDLTAFNQGLRGVILHIRRKLDADLSKPAAETAKTEE